MTWGLRARLVVLFFFTVGILCLSLTVFLPGHLDGLSQRWSESRSVGIAKLLARMGAVPLDFDDRQAATAMLADLQATRGVTYAVLFRQDGTVLASWHEPPPGSPPPR